MLDWAETTDRAHGVGPSQFCIALKINKALYVHNFLSNVAKNCEYKIQCGGFFFWGDG